MKQHELFMRMAIKLAEENVQQGKGGPFGAVVVKDGQLIAAAANSVVPLNDPTAHAEVTAIRKACQVLQTFNLQGCVIYTSCEPCPMCLSAIYWAHIEHIYYANTKVDAAAIGFDDDHIYQQIALPHPERKIPQHQMMAAEGSVAFKLWSESENKIDY